MGTPNTNPVVRFLVGIRFFLSDAHGDETEKTLFSKKNGVRFLTRALYTVPFNDLMLTVEYLRGLKRSCF